MIKDVPVAGDAFVRERTGRCESTLIERVIQSTMSSTNVGTNLQCLPTPGTD
jgi:hypothetical protein